MTDLSRRAFIKLTGLVFGWYGSGGRLVPPQPGQPPRELVQFEERKDPEKIIQMVAGEDYAKVDGKIACAMHGEVVSDWADIEFRIHMPAGFQMIVSATHSCEFQFDETVVIDGVYIDTPYFWYDLPIEGFAKTVNPGDTVRLEIGSGPLDG